MLADLETVPTLAAPERAADALAWPWADELDRWRNAAGAGPTADQIVVAAWVADVGEPAPLVSLSVDAWMARSEIPFARWFAAMGVAARRCADHGSVVAVIERPPPLDAALWAPESGLADAVESMVRSLARAQGSRGVRVNAVTTPLRLHRPPVVDPAPSLATFPGTMATEVLGAVRMLLGPEAAGVTGTVVHADCGRSWR
jgi:NAD(P)-dependent dehydrogenase (short-subunit alcohol dehydrogenase family)